ncbi:caspase, EACC1-associated type [Nocardia sp. NPDC004582]
MTLPDSERSRAILIGVSTYQSGSGFEPLPQVATNLRELATALRELTGLRHISVIADPTRPVDIGEPLKAAIDTAQDLLLVYYSGHGVIVDDQLALTHAESHTGNLEFTTLAYDTIHRRLRTSHARVKLVILDCCNSGKAFGSGVLAATDPNTLLADLAYLPEISGSCVLTSTGTSAKSRFALANGPRGCTAFTGALLDLLHTDDADDGEYRTLATLFPRLDTALQRLGAPSPRLSNRDTAAAIALVRNRRGPIAAPASTYRAQIRDLAPDRLLDREPELARLAEFCTGAEPYLYLQAGPWAGKTALLSWFVLHPPENVLTVGFFITARLVGQADHTAFTDALIDQLLTVVPARHAAVPTGAGEREGFRRHLIEQACDAAAAAGQRLVLVVDGLDEDRGEPSIASLLPRNRHPALRVLVAGRPNPPIPLDTSPDHPLRECARLPLQPSPAARNLAQSAQWELKQLLAGTPAQRDVVGLVTATGGLSDLDLQDLTGLAPYELDTIVHGPTGRTFHTTHLTSGADPVNLLAHETLNDAAQTALGPRLLTRYRDRIHDWATEYRRRRWPADSPHYLLYNYPQLLRDHGDGERLRQLALDTDRHERLWERAGVDALAYREIDWAAELLLAADRVDLHAGAALAAVRGRLSDRRGHIPWSLPAVWARLGEIDHAEALVRSTQIQYRANVAEPLIAALVALGECDRAATIFAEYATESTTARIHLAQGYARRHDLTRAQELVDATPALHGSDRAAVQTVIAEVLIDEDDLDGAQSTTLAITDTATRERVYDMLIPALFTRQGAPAAERFVGHRIDAFDSAAVAATLALATAFIAAGQPQRALDFARRISRGRFVDVDGDRVIAAVAAVAARVGPGHPELAAQLENELHDLLAGRSPASPLSDATCRALSLADLAAGRVAAAYHREIDSGGGRIGEGELCRALIEALIADGELDKAIALVSRWLYPDAEIVLPLIDRLVGDGELDRAVALASTSPTYDADTLFARIIAVTAQRWSVDRASELAGRFPHGQRGTARSAIAEFLVAAGESDRAETLALAAPADHRGAVLADLAATCTRAGDRRRAVRLAQRSERATHDEKTDAVDPETTVLATFAAALISAGHPDAADTVIRLRDYDTPAALRARCILADAFLDAGDTRRALHWCDGAEQAVRDRAADQRIPVYRTVARVCLEAGLDQRTRDITAQAPALLDVAAEQSGWLYVGALELLCAVGELPQAGEFALTAPAEIRDQAIRKVATAAVNAGSGLLARELVDRADLSFGGDEADHRRRLREHVAQALARTGDLDYAQTLLATPEPMSIGESRVDLVVAVAAHYAATGDTARAEALVDTLGTLFRPRALAELATTYGRDLDEPHRASRLLDDAERAWAELTDKYSWYTVHSHDQRAVARGRIASGELERAEQLTAAITNGTYGKDDMLVELARAHHRAGNHQRARRKLAEALSFTSNWSRTLAELAVIDPAELASIVEYLYT